MHPFLVCLPIAPTKIKIKIIKIKKMKKAICFLGFLIALMPLRFGQLRYDQAIREINVRMELDRNFGTDSDIEGVLSESGFPIGWDDSPTFVQFYKVGLKQIK